MLHFLGDVKSRRASKSAILLIGWILPIGGALAVEGLRSTGPPRLVSISPQFSVSFMAGFFCADLVCTVSLCMFFTTLVFVLTITYFIIRAEALLFHFTEI